MADGADHERPERVARDEAGPDLGVGAHHLALVGGERPALAEHGIGHRDPAQVVQEPADRHHPERGPGSPIFSASRRQYCDTRHRCPPV